MFEKSMSFWRASLISLVAFFIAGCGGGTGGSAAGAPVAAGAPTLSLTVVDTVTGSTTTSVTAANPARLDALVRNASGAPVAGAVVTFSTGGSALLSFVPGSGTALTGTDGRASVLAQVAPTSQGGATSVDAAVSVGGRALTATTNVSVGSGSNSGTGGTTPGTPRLSLALFDASGVNPITSLSGGQQGVAKATVLDGQTPPRPVVGAIVAFSVSDTTLASIAPATALTDANGVATATVAPLSLSASGATTLGATVSVSGVQIGTTQNFAVGAANLVLGTMTLSPTTASVGSTISVQVPVLSNGQPFAGSSAPVTITSGCLASGDSTIGAGTVNNGVYSAVYRNIRCVNSPDVVSAQLGNSQASANLTITPPNIGTIQFVGSSSAGQSLVPRGTGGTGRVESALLTFKVVDQTNTGLPGVQVTFAPTTTAGGLTVAPTSGVTDASGVVTTTISSGTVPTPVRVSATATRNGQVITGLSDALSISTGLPIQRSASLSASVFNIEGDQYDGERSDITMRLADQYGNPVADGTSVNFIAAGGAIGTSAQGACQTTNGTCTVPFFSQNFRPANRRVTVLAYALGIKTFTDLNGDGALTCSDGTINRTNDPPCSSSEFVPSLNDMGDPFLSVDGSGLAVNNPLNGNNYRPANDDRPIPFSGTTFAPTGNGFWGLTYVRQSLQVVFSESSAALLAAPLGAPARLLASDEVVANFSTCSPQTFGFYVAGARLAAASPQVLNALPFGTAVAAQGTPVRASVGAFFPSSVANSVGPTFHQVTLAPDTTICPAGAPTPTTPGVTGSFSISVTSPKGVGTVYTFRVQY
jgi:hypothetical protein